MLNPKHAAPWLLVAICILWIVFLRLDRSNASSDGASKQAALEAAPTELQPSNTGAVPSPAITRNTGSPGGPISAPETTVTKPSKHLEFRQPATPSELSLLRSQYKRLPGYYSALDIVYEDEPRDEPWATAVEGAFAETAAAFPGMRIIEGDCRKSLCRFTIELARPLEPGPDDQRWGIDLMDRIAGTRYEGEVEFYVILETRKRRVYFYSRELPSPYAERLHALLH